jgi:hypothetical protein
MLSIILLYLIDRCVRRILSTEPHGSPPHRNRRVAMLIAVREHGVGLSADGRGYAIDRVGHALASVEEHVRRVTVYLTDENGPRGGSDKKCRVSVLLDTGRPVTVEARGESLTGVVDGAAGRAEQVVHEEIHRRNDRRRTGRLVRALKELKLLFRRKGNQP